MAKNILVVHASPRKGGNSSMLADEFVKGAEAAGNPGLQRAYDLGASIS